MIGEEFFDEVTNRLRSDMHRSNLFDQGYWQGFNAATEEIYKKIKISPLSRLPNEVN